MEVTWKPTTCRHKEGLSGLIVTFHDTDPACDGGISFCDQCKPQGPVWNIQKEDPLTVSPSIQCRTHSHHHGHIQNGKWVPA